MNAVEVAENPYSRLVSWEVWNFMSIEHGKCEFDEKNIINLKGYNDSGKSAMLTALKVLISNSNPTKQASFIQDEKDYFRVLGTFSDGVQILRDKYINGQSLYEMYKDGELIYTTKSGNALTKVSDVPKPIADYLGLIMYDGSCLNARACFEKQLGVQTTGSENYKMFNTVLKSEEIAVASSMLNNDKNKLAADINAVDNELQANKSFLGVGQYITDGMISYLKNHDTTLDSLEVSLVSLSNISNQVNNLNSIVVYPELDCVDTTQLSDLMTVENIINSLNLIPNIPVVATVDSIQLEELEKLQNIVSGLSNIAITPELGIIDCDSLNALNSISGIVSNIAELDKDIKDTEVTIIALSEELESLQEELKSHGVAVVKCPDCGSVFSPDCSHSH